MTDLIDNILDSISNCQSKAIKCGKTFDETIHADFTYYKGCTYQYINGIASLVKKGDKDSRIFGVKCVDHCTLEMQTGSYWLSYNESYPIRYYKVNKDVKETYSNEKRVNVEVMEVYLDEIEYQATDEHKKCIKASKKIILGD